MKKRQQHCNTDPKNQKRPTGHNPSAFQHVKTLDYLLLF